MCPFQLLHHSFDFLFLRDKAGHGPVRASLFPHLSAISGAAVPLSAEVQRQEHL